MKKVHVKDLTKKGCKYKIVLRSEETVIANDVETVFNNLEEAMLKVEQYIQTGKIVGGAVQIKEVVLN